jgi:adenylylsulfate kinase
MNSNFTIWITGLSWSGKTTLSEALYQKLSHEYNYQIACLDGDVFRRAFTKPLDFSSDGRRWNIETAALVSKILNEQNISVIGAFISPYEKDREWIRESVQNYIEIYLSTPLEVCEKRDVKWLYKKARDWVIKGFTGISDPYEIPRNPNLSIDTNICSIDDSVNQIIVLLREKKLI